MKTILASILALLLFSTTAGSAPQSQKPAIHFHPDAPLMDEVIHFRLSGLPPGKAVTLRAQTTLQGKLWQAQATFTADEQGKVDVSKQVPASGSYTGADRMHKGYFEQAVHQFEEAFRLAEAASDPWTASHAMTVPSAAADTSVWRSGRKATVWTQAAWPAG